MKITVYLGFLFFLSYEVAAQLPSSPEIPKEVIVTAKRANLRTEPSRAARVLSSVRFKKILIVYAWDQGDWYLVRYRKVRGWIHIADVLPLEIPATKAMEASEAHSVPF